jgi:hypothetical protein
MDAASGVWAVLSGPDGCGLSRWGVDGGEPVSVPLPGGVKVLALTPLLDGMRVLARQHPDGQQYVLDLDLIGEVRRVIGLGGERACPKPVGVAVSADRILLEVNCGLNVAQGEGNVGREFAGGVEEQPFFRPRFVLAPE